MSKYIFAPYYLKTLFLSALIFFCIIDGSLILTKNENRTSVYRNSRVSFKTLIRGYALLKIKN